MESDRALPRSEPRVVLRTERLVSFVALIIFFASGFSALLYQVIWQRILGFFSGADVYSVTIIVAAYMAGMGIGSLTGGYLADRLSRWGNLALFAGVELGIALFALGSKGFYYDWLYQQNAHLASSPILMAIVLFASLLIPTFCMGVSLPALARALTRSIDLAAGTIGSLYGINTLGAAIGAGVTTWVLLRQYSFETILHIGAAINALVAFTAFPMAWFLVRSGNIQPSVSPTPTTSPETTHLDQAPIRQLPVPVWITLYGLSGFIALSLEILWFRMLGVMLKSTAFTFGTLLTIFLGGLALGTFLGIRRAPHDRRPMNSFLLLQTGVIVCALVTITVFVGQVNHVSLLAPFWFYFGGYDPLNVGDTAALPDFLFNPGALTPEVSQFARFFLLLYVMLPVILIGPPTIFMGMSFPLHGNEFPTAPKNRSARPANAGQARRLAANIEHYRQYARHAADRSGGAVVAGNVWQPACHWRVFGNLPGAVCMGMPGASVDAPRCVRWQRGACVQSGAYRSGRADLLGDIARRPAGECYCCRRQYWTFPDQEQRQRFFPASVCDVQWNRTERHSLWLDA